MSEKKKPRMIKTRFWFVTANPKGENAAVPPPELDSEALFYSLSIEHVGTQSGLNHYHCMLHFKDQVTMYSVKGYWGCLWIDCEPQRLYVGASEYLKDGHTAVAEFWEQGKPVTQGYRTDIQTAIAAIRGGATASQVRLSQPNLYRISHCVDQMVQDVRYKPAMTKGRRAVCVLWGPPDKGKTIRYKTKYGVENCFTVDIHGLQAHQNHRFDNYMYEENIILEDLKPQIHTVDYIKQLITTDHTTVDCRYSPKPCSWTRVLITSNFDPTTWWAYEPDRDKVMSRITHIEYIDGQHTPSELFPYVYDADYDRQVPI